MAEDDVREKPTGTLIHVAGWFSVFLVFPWCLLTTIFAETWTNAPVKPPMLWSAANAAVVIFIPAAVVFAGAAMINTFVDVSERWSDRRARQKYADVAGGPVELDKDAWSAMDDGE